MSSYTNRLGVQNVFEFSDMYRKTNESKTPSNSQDWRLIIELFDVGESKGELFVPETFYGKIQQWFGKLDDGSIDDPVLRVEEQKIVRIVNKWTFEQTLFNPLRAFRPMNNDMYHKTYTDISDELQEIPEKCDFCSPINYTAIDVWGRIERDTCLTASNCAKYDAMHSLIIFKDHSPVKYTKEKLNDVFSICGEWFRCANENNAKAIYPTLHWNCKLNSGASQLHAHANLILTEKFHCGKWQFLQNCCQRYYAAYGRNYFLDLVSASKALGLVKTVGFSNIVTNLTPTFVHDFYVIGWNFDKDFRDAMDSAIKTLMERFDALTFNIGILFPPLEDGKIRSRVDLFDMDAKLAEGDLQMPFIAYLVNRDDASNGKHTSDVCGMKLHGSNIVSSDPFENGKVMRIPDILWT